MFPKNGPNIWFSDTSLDHFTWKVIKLSAEIWTTICPVLGHIWFLDVRISDSFCIYSVDKQIVELQGKKVASFQKLGQLSPLKKASETTQSPVKNVTFEKLGSLSPLKKAPDARDLSELRARAGKLLQNLSAPEQPKLTPQQVKTIFTIQSTSENRTFRFGRTP